MKRLHSLRLAFAIALAWPLLTLEPAHASGHGGGGGEGGKAAEECKLQSVSLIAPILNNGKLSGTKVLEFSFCIKEGPGKDAFKEKKVKIIDALNLKFYGHITQETSNEEIMTDAYELVIEIMTPEIMKDIKFEMTHDAQSFQICEKKGQGPAPCPK